MQLNEYQKQLNQFLLPSAKNKDYLTLGLAAEAGEVMDVFAKAIRDENGFVDISNLRKELGDVLFFVSVLADMYRLPLQEIAETNLEKLHDRKRRNKIGGSGDNR
jgi:NTP pyrophosphatase (non-canonical NTP hydrolase)